MRTKARAAHRRRGKYEKDDHDWPPDHWPSNRRPERFAVLEQRRTASALEVRHLRQPRLNGAGDRLSSSASGERSRQGSYGATAEGRRASCIWKGLVRRRESARVCACKCARAGADPLFRSELCSQTHQHRKDRAYAEDYLRVDVPCNTSYCRAAISLACRSACVSTSARSRRRTSRCSLRESWSPTQGIGTSPLRFGTGLG